VSAPARNGAIAVTASQIRRERVQWLWPGRIPLGAVTLVAGDPGLGKSLLTCSLAARLSRGELLGGPGASLLVTAEDSLAATLRPRLDAAAANLEAVRFVQMWRDGCEDGIRLPQDVAELDRLAAEHDARLVVIDPLMAHLPMEVNSFRDQSVRLALAPLAAMAEARRCAVVVVVHLNKATSSDPLGRIGGSIGIPAAARSVLLLARNPEDGDQSSRRVLAHVKCNVAELADSVECEVETILLPAQGNDPEVKTARLVEVGASSLSPRDLLTAGGDNETSKVEEAMDFLADALADAPRPSEEIKAAARSEGIAPKTLRTARERLGVIDTRHGFPSKTQWVLPSRQGHDWRGESSRAEDGHDRPGPSTEPACALSFDPEISSDALSGREGTTGTDGDV
jgi:AAA domain